MAITTPFAQNGDKKEIPQTTSDGSLSFDKGFGSLYALPPEEGGLFIDREQFNQLVFQITEAILANQQSLSSLSGNVYNKGEVDVKVNAKANQSTTYTKTEVDTKVNAKANANAVVNLSGNQTIAGIKTWSSPLVIPNGTANNHAVNLAQLNTKANANATVNLTGNQTIGGNKKFSAVPTCDISPTANNHLANKAYIDSIGQVPDYRAEVSITFNRAFTAQFNGVVEIYCRAGSGYHWAFCLGNTNNNKAIMSGATSGSGEVWDAGQAIITKGETYYFHANAHVYRAVMYPFKSVRSR